MRRKQIIDEAFKLFARHGYDSATMRQIGSAVGLDKSSLYVHFKSKNEIFEENLRCELVQFEECVLNKLAQGNIESLVRRLFVEIITYFMDRDKLLFWKHISLLSASGAEAQVSRQAHAAIEGMHKLVMGKLEAELKMVREDKLSKISLHLYILIQGFLDWLLIQEEVDFRTIQIAEEVYDNTFGCSMIFD